MSRDGNRGETIEQENESETVGTKPTRLQELCFEATQSMPRGGVRVPGRVQAVVLQVLPDTDVTCKLIGCRQSLSQPYSVATSSSYTGVDLHPAGLDWK